MTGDPFTWPETDGSGHDRVDETDLRQREGLLQRADGNFLTNVVGAFAEDCRPSDVQLGGRIFEFDAHLPARRCDRRLWTNLAKLAHPR